MFCRPVLTTVVDTLLMLIVMTEDLEQTTRNFDKTKFYTKLFWERFRSFQICNRLQFVVFVQKKHVFWLFCWIVTAILIQIVLIAAHNTMLGTSHTETTYHFYIFKIFKNTKMIQNDVYMLIHKCRFNFDVMIFLGRTCNLWRRPCYNW